MNKIIIEPSVSVSHPLAGRLATHALQKFIEAMRMGGGLSDPSQSAEDSAYPGDTSIIKRNNHTAARALRSTSDGLKQSIHASLLFQGSGLVNHITINGVLCAVTHTLPASERGRKRVRITHITNNAT